jgi:hypothetical protein
MRILWFAIALKASMSGVTVNVEALQLVGCAPRFGCKHCGIIQVRSGTTSSLSSRSEVVDKELLQCFAKEHVKSVEDPLGCFAEKAFIITRAQLKDSDFLQRLLYAHVKPNSPARYFTYSQLCRDPLLLLKCPINVGPQELRRIVLLSSPHSLDTNESLVRHVSRADTRDRYSPRGPRWLFDATLRQ